MKRKSTKTLKTQPDTPGEIRELSVAELSQVSGAGFSVTKLTDASSHDFLIAIPIPPVKF